MGLIVGNIDVSFQISSTMMHFIDARWQQHKGVMWLCQLQSLQLTQPLGRWQPPSRWLMTEKWCGCVSCKVCKWHSHLGTWLMVERVWLCGLQSLQVTQPLWKSGTYWWIIKSIDMAVPTTKLAACTLPRHFWSWLRACPCNAMWQVPTHQISWFYANMNQSYACCSSYPMYLRLVHRPP